ncbi:glutamate 5-kinase [Companilactobacillus alimentarius]|uniref:Glutamate 5-kinase n=1 Tax=Companilactobacillus alimentarius DSM 20249 TaxID=1423720 RepID=A0A2K9HIY4_9LACO|nr:glutamate 5-kinase [Companilactobacillus alimentarius]AUI72489.1 glutamate 5-kinase [Companilactobacillus alimentarius DSM 20249]KRK77742.1 gamma-glutamyl kinase [Companilactobacillus alimentarius DSM 20249]GEO45020.1 glutamate 5-kinase [Companilactobacillus alimentarius]
MQNKRQISADRIVIKVGTSTLIRQNSQINLPVIKKLAYVLSTLKKNGKDVVLVSSGAIGVGMGVLNIDQRPIKISKQQAVAAVGQAELMQIYNEAFHEYGMSVAQILITRDIIDYPESHTNVMNSFQELLSMDNTIPIVNENDTVTVSELDHHTKFGDNDQLSAIVTNLVDADLLIMLSDIDGFYSANPLKVSDATLIDTIKQIDPEIIAAAGGHGTKYGTGGMTTKLKAAELILKHNQQMILTNGKDPEIIFNLLAGDPIGTLFSKNI